MSGSARWLRCARLAMVLAVAACGSTVQVSGHDLAPLQTSVDGGTASQPVSSTGAEPVAGGSLQQPGGTSVAPGVVPPASPSGSTGDVAGAGPALTNAPGVTATEIKVGILYSVNGNQAARAVGYNLDRGNEQLNWKVVIADVNAHGGVAGRRLVPVYYAFDAYSSQPASTQEQAACAHFTQDTRVFAVLTPGSPDFTACLDRAGVMHVTTGSYVGHDRAFYRRFPAFFEQRPSQERYQADLVSALVRQKYFRAWDTLRGTAGTSPVKVGVLVSDRPDYVGPVEHVLLPALRRAGYPVDPSLVLRAPITPDAQEAGPGTAATKSAVLRFQQAGVTHVIVLDYNGTTTLLFAQNSQSQLYFPRLGVTSASGIQQLYDLKALSSKQVNGVAGLGWTPTLDLPVGKASRYLSAGATYCLDVYRRAKVTFSSTTAEGLGMFACDSVFPLATALQGLRGPLTRAAAVRAFESVGGRLLAASVPRLFFSPSQHDGLATAFDMVWDSACPCIRYADNGHRMP